jgi:anti-sigma factor (TIGR02949 family)
MSEHISCEAVIERLLEFLDRELDADAQRAIAQHMEVCRACYSRAEFERRLRARVAETGKVSAPESLRRRVRAIIERY